jgi:hypothetical protein
MGVTNNGSLSPFPPPLRGGVREGGGGIGTARVAPFPNLESEPRSPLCVT